MTKFSKLFVTGLALAATLAAGAETITITLDTPVTPAEKQEQRSFFFWYEPEQRRNIIASLRHMKRTDLIDRLYGHHPNDPHARPHAGRSRKPTRGHHKK